MGSRSTLPLYDRLLDGELKSILQELRTNGVSFSEIAFKLRDEHDVKIDPTTVMRWCQELGIEQERAS